MGKSQIYIIIIYIDILLEQHFCSAAGEGRGLLPVLTGQRHGGAEEEEEEGDCWV